MTLSSTTSKQTFDGDGAQTVFPTPFVFQVNADVLVVLRKVDGTEVNQVLGTDYELEGALSESGGTVTMNIAPAVGEKLTVKRDPAPTQDARFPLGGEFPSTAAEAAIDRVVMIVQSLIEIVGRAIRVPLSDTAGSLELPTDIDRAGKVMTFDDDGVPQASELADLDTSLETVLSNKKAADVLQFDGTRWINKPFGDVPFAAESASITRGLAARFDDKVDVLDYIPAAQHAAIRAGTSTYDAKNDVQNLIDALETAGIKTTIRFPRGTYVFKSGLTIDARYVAIAGDRTTFDFSGLSASAGAAVRIEGSATGAGSTTDLWEQLATGIAGIRLLGPGDTVAGVYGLVWGNAVSAANTGPSHMSARDVIVQEFAEGIRFENQAYAIDHYHVDVFNCATGINMPSGFTEYGERISFFGGTVFHQDVAVACGNGSADLYFFGSSFDFNEQLAELTGGFVAMFGCHWENGDLTTDYPIEVSGNGTTLLFQGGYVIGGDDDSTISAHVSCSAGDDGGAFFRDSFMTRMDNTTDGRFAADADGRVELSGISTFNVANHFTVVSDNARHNLLNDGGFESTAIFDDLFIHDGNATDRFTLTGFSVATSTAQARTGSRSLGMTKSTGSGSSSTVLIVVPCRQGESFNYEYYYKQPDTAATGTFFAGHGWCRLTPPSPLEASDGRPYSVRRSQQGGSNLTAVAADWTKVASSQQTREAAPAWATHFYVELNLGSWAASSGAGGDAVFYVDDMIISKVG